MYLMKVRLERLSLASLVALLVAACGHTPTRTPEVTASAVESVPAPVGALAATTTVAEEPVGDAAAASETLGADSDNGDDDLSLNGTIVEPTTAEEAVASAVAEENLLNRIRAGFAMEDMDHVSIDREVAWFARHPDYLDRTFRRAERYLYFIVEELEARNMPLELALLPLVESAFNPVALSRARAAGLWQFIPSTGRRYGLEQNHAYDGRRDVMESTRAALDYLQFLANEFDGNWHQAVAAYNAGEMNVARAIARNRALNRPTDFFSLDLPRETRAYVPKLLAIRRIVAEPEKYGLEFGRIANQPYFVKVELEAPVDLGVAARLAGLPKEDLVALNPAYRRAVTSSDGPGYLLVPTQNADELRAGLAQLSPAQRVPKIYYTVHRGDTVSTIARKLGVSQDELRTTNKIKGNLLHIGQELVVDRGSVTLTARAPEPPMGERLVTQDPNYVPPPLPSRIAQPSQYGETHRVRRGETLSSIARAYGVSVGFLATQNNISAKSRLRKGQKLWIPPAVSDGAATTLATINTEADTVQRISYVVRSGDTLTQIAKRFNVSTSDLLVWNKLRSANRIKVGQKLQVYVDSVPSHGS